MAEGVVDLFEVIEIGHNEGERTRLAAGALQLAREDFEHGVAVPEVGERIAGGLAAQHFASRHQLFLQIQNALPGTQPHAQLVRVHRFAEVVVGARLHSFNELVGGVFGG